MISEKISPEFSSRVVVGYHGTSADLAEKALKDKRLLASLDDRGDWLAEGTYFWEDSLDMAQRWAQKLHPSAPAVIRAEIRLGRCLNLLDSKWDDAVNAGFKQLQTESVGDGSKVPENMGHHHYRDFKVIKHLCETKFSVDTVRGAFTHDKEMFEGGFGQLAHVEIAVRNADMILSLERSYPFPFTAYLASALTGLTPEQRKDIDAKQSLIKDACRERGIELYLPKEKTDPELHKNISPEEVFFSDIKQVLKSDLFILMTNYPSFGGGMELKTALDALLPIIVVSPANIPITRMILGIPSVRSRHVRYTTENELRANLQDAISYLRQNMTDRKDSLKTQDATVGTEIAKLRTRAGLLQEQLAASVGLTVEAQSRLEASPDYVTNPSLLSLRKFAQALGTTVAGIVDPDFVRIVAEETLKLAEEGAVLVRARQGSTKASVEDQLPIILVALQDRLSRNKSVRSRQLD